ncbi:MAG TPA: glycogen synthase GlgA [Methylocella sp.]|nr:glycogen synthase GlgA [Methylocella sp.]
MSSLTVLAVASEIYPLIKTGGLADVAGALASALAAEDVAVVTLIPGYPAVMNKITAAERVWTEPDLFGDVASVLHTMAAGLDLFVLDAPHLFARSGGPYVSPDGHDWPDNPFRFAALCQTAARLAFGECPRFRPDVVHAHDWQAGLTAAYLTYDGRRRPATVITIHNLAFQGQYPASLLAPLGLPPRAFAIDGVEYYGMIGFLKAGLLLSDKITTVSPAYAAEIRTPEHGMGLDGLLRARSASLTGILNGIDEAVWNPQEDAWLAAPYSVETRAKRGFNKIALQKHFGLAAQSNALLFGAVSRLTWQKGVDLILANLDLIAQMGGQLALLGTGEPSLEEALQAAAQARPGQMSVMIGYDERTAHMIQAGADALLIPSRFEPCGLTQLCAMRYGAVPIAARVGGLMDTIVDANEMAVASRLGTGILFSPGTTSAFGVALERAGKLWREPEVWDEIRMNGMKTDVSWRHPAAAYARLFRELVAGTG